MYKQCINLYSYFKSITVDSLNYWKKYCFQWLTCSTDEAQLNNCFSMEVESKEGTNPIKFWKKHSKNMPMFSRPALHMLGIPATSATVNRVFICGGLIMKPHQVPWQMTPSANYFFLWCKRTTPSNSWITWLVIHNVSRSCAFACHRQLNSYRLQYQWLHTWLWLNKISAIKTWLDFRLQPLTSACQTYDLRFQRKILHSWLAIWKWWLFSALCCWGYHSMLAMRYGWWGSGWINLIG